VNSGILPFQGRDLPANERAVQRHPGGDRPRAGAASLVDEHHPNVVIALLYREDEDYLLFDGHSGSYGDVLDQPHMLPITQGVTGAAVTSRTVQIVNDVRKDPRYVPPPVPMVLGEQVFGCINLEGLNAFDEDDVASIQIIADHLAVAIENVSLSREARLAAVMRERQRLARDLHDAVSQALSSIGLMSQSIVTAWRRDPAEGERRARRIEELSRLAFAEMRALLRELRPDPCIDFGANTADAPRIADVMARGRSNRQIGDQLHLTEGTVKAT
jgi:signal transduction histidine kinase